MPTITAIQMAHGDWWLTRDDDADGGPQWILRSLLRLEPWQTVDGAYQPITGTDLQRLLLDGYPLNSVVEHRYAAEPGGGGPTAQQAGGGLLAMYGARHAEVSTAWVGREIG